MPGSFGSRVMVRYLMLEALSTFLILCCTIPLIASLAGPKVLSWIEVSRMFYRSACGSQLSWPDADLCISMLTLQTPYLVAVRIISSGTPCAHGISPPNSLHFFTNSGKTVDAPWSTRGVLGIRLWISLRRSKSRYGSPLNLYAPWLVPIATAGGSTPVFLRIPQLPQER